MSRIARSLTILALLLALPAATSAHGVKTKAFEVVHPWSFGAAAGETVKVCMKIKNIGRRSDRLLRAETPLAEAATLVERAAAAPTGERAVPSIAIGRGKHAELAMNGQSILLTGLRKPLSAYDTFPLTLVFEHAGRLEVEVLVEEGAAPDAPVR